jgi:hypothetical protein
MDNDNPPNTSDSRPHETQKISEGSKLVLLHRFRDIFAEQQPKFDPDQYRVRENASSVAQSFEDEDDDEHL